MTIDYKIRADNLRDATVIVPKGFSDRGVIKCYDHMERVVCFPRDVDLSLDGSDALNTASLPCDDDQAAFVVAYSYPLDTAQQLAIEINTH